MKSSKHSRAFAAEHGLPSGDPNTFSPDQVAAFETYKKERNQERLHQHYEKRKENGTAPRHKPASEMTQDELERRRQWTAQSCGKTYALKQALRNVAIRHGLPVPNHMNETNLSDLRELLRQKMSDAELQVIEDTAAMEYAKNPHKRKMADADGKRKPGPLPASRSAGDVDRDDARKKALSAEREMRSYARRRALYDQANHFAAMVPFANLTIEQIRIILRQNMTDAEIAEIENHAVQTYDATHELVERKGTTSRSTDLLTQFFEKFPNVPRVLTVGQLSHENHGRYRAFLRSLDVERFRAREREYDAAHREERSEAGRRQRQEEPERFRENERRYEKSDKGKSVRRAYEKLDHVRDFRKAWRERNVERVRQFGRDYRARNLNKERARILRNNAINMGVEYTLTSEEHDHIRTHPCGYCGETSDTVCITQEEMGKGYTADNSIPACKACTSTKRRFGKEDFVLSMANVAATHLEDDDWEYDFGFPDPSQTRIASSFEQYRKNAESAGRAFEIDESDYSRITTGGCFYCLFDERQVGMDRVDNTEGYVSTNLVGCCNRCNEMKGTKTIDEFVEVAVKVYNHVYKAK